MGRGRSYSPIFVNLVIVIFLVLSLMLFATEARQLRVSAPRVPIDNVNKSLTEVHSVSSSDVGNKHKHFDQTDAVNDQPGPSPGEGHK